jgi:hypothetical protein
MADLAVVEKILAIWISIPYGGAVVWCTLALTTHPSDTCVAGLRNLNQAPAIVRSYPGL